MAELETQFRKAVEAYKASKKAEARELLLDVVDKDERHEQAWLYLSALVDTLEEQQICLENVLEINPGNERARKGLDKISQQLAARRQETASRNPTREDPTLPEPVTPFSSLDWDSIHASPAPGSLAQSGGPIGAEFASFSGDAMLGSAPASTPAIGGMSAVPNSLAPGDGPDWFSLVDNPLGSVPTAPASDPFAAPAAADWGQAPAAPSAPPAHGSGKQVNLPSEQEYDEWVQKLNLRTGGVAKPTANTFEPLVPETTHPFTSDGAGPFGETGYMLGEDVGQIEAPAEDRGSASRGSTFASDAWSGRAEGRTTSERPEALRSTYPIAGGLGTSGYGAGSFFEGEDAEDQSPFEAAVLYEPGEALEADNEDLSYLDLSFNFGDDESAGMTDFAGDGLEATELGRYFALIPEDVELGSGASVRRALFVVGVLVMLAANAVSYYMLLR